MQMTVKNDSTNTTVVNKLTKTKKWLRYCEEAVWQPYSKSKLELNSKKSNSSDANFFRLC